MTMKHNKEVVELLIARCSIHELHLAIATLIHADLTYLFSPNLANFAYLTYLPNLAILTDLTHLRQVDYHRDLTHLRQQLLY